MGDSEYLRRWAVKFSFREPLAERNPGLTEPTGSQDLNEATGWLWSLLHKGMEPGKANISPDSRAWQAERGSRVERLPPRPSRVVPTYFFFPLSCQAFSFHLLAVCF